MSSLRRASVSQRQLRTLKKEAEEASQKGQHAESGIISDLETVEELPVAGGDAEQNRASEKLPSPPTTLPQPTRETIDKTSARITLNTQQSGQSAVNSPRSQDDNKKIWGGKMIDSIQAVDGNISLFSDECLSVHGLYDAFYSRNGWGRTIVYLLTWILFGVFFFVLTAPLIQDYNGKALTSHVYVDELIEIGETLPVVTVCPHGTGIQCDCQLWRKLYCRYQVDVPNREWRNRFGAYGCAKDFRRDGNNQHVWVDPQCEQFSNETSMLAEDTCMSTPEEVAALPFLAKVNGSTLFDAIVKREESEGGPYITYEEQMIYGSRRVSDKVRFYTKASVLHGVHLENVNSEWVTDTYVEMSRFQICTQFRPPQTAKQTLPGSMNGVTIHVTHMDDSYYSINDAHQATPAIDIHINTIDPEQYDDLILHVERNTYFPVAAGSNMNIEYGVVEMDRKQGWGKSLLSRKCQYDALPRSSCVEKTLLNRASAVCNCSALKYFNYPAAVGVISGAAACSAIRNTSENACVDRNLQLKSRITLEQCPPPCHDVWGTVTSNFQTTLSEYQVEYMREVKAKMHTTKSLDESIMQRGSAIIHIGADTLTRLKYREDPKTTIGALLGQIGGNAGLWCGLSFVLMLELLEFLVVAILFGSGFYAGGRRAMVHRARRFFGHNGDSSR